MPVVIIGLVLIAAGVGLIAAVAVGALAAWPLVMAIIFVVFGLALVATGREAVRSRRRRQYLMVEGLAGAARIESVAQTSLTVNDQPVVKFGLSVAVADRAAYPVTVREAVPLLQLARVAVGAVLAVRVDPARPDQVEIDWDTPAAEVSSAAQQPTIQQPTAQQPIMELPPGIVLPRVPERTDRQPAQLPEQVRAIGAPGRAIVDTVRVSDTDGYLLDMWVQLDSGPSYRMENAPARVDPRYAAKVRPGVTVPVRVAQIRPGVSMAVLEWEKL
ncbi:hypothetical protein GCM10023322_12060 [Rugosimonospora acidiphila]|uniref:S1 motif domain-containing protein n=1 Tax=Rugosimonospora acidiphila TaxID=556531 RepID=A0ABP9RN09_9ACTN